MPKLQYISLFAGIGGFELGIERAFKKQAKCVAFSEVHKQTIRIYKNHYPNTAPLGDIMKISKKQIGDLYKKVGGIDLVVGGFPCKNLSLLGDKRGLKGEKSGLFIHMIRVIRYIKDLNDKKRKKTWVIVENVKSLPVYQQEITRRLKSLMKMTIYKTEVSGKHFSAQKRLRFFWTNFPVKDPTGTGPLLKTILHTKDQVRKNFDDLVMSKEFIAYMNRGIKVKGNSSSYSFVTVVKKQSSGSIPIHEFRTTKKKGNIYKSRWQSFYIYSDSACPKSKTIASMDPHAVLVDRRFGNNKDQFLIRRFSPIELERLFNFPDHWTKYYDNGDLAGKSIRKKALGNSVVVGGIEYVAKHLKKAL